MGSHPINLALRFILELVALLSVGIWGWNITDEWFKLILAFLFPAVLTTIWGVFAVPNDPSRSGNAPVPTSGIVRLFIELVIFFIAIWALKSMGFTTICFFFTTFVILHYILSYDRIKWLLSQ